MLTFFLIFRLNSKYREETYSRYQIFDINNKNRFYIEKIDLRDLC